MLLIVDECYQKFTVTKTKKIPRKHEIASRKNKFEKYIVEGTDANDERHEEDSDGRKIKICNGNADDELNYFVCDEKLVVPRYLIQFQTECQWRADEQ